MAFTRKAGTKKRKRRRMTQAEKEKFKARMAKGRRAAKKRRPAKTTATKKRKKRSKREGSVSHENILAAMRAYSGEGRHGDTVYKYKKAGRARRRKPSNIVLSENPIHFPKTARGRPSKIRYWLLDVYKGNKITSYIGRSDKTTAQRDAMRKLVKTGADRVALNGPYVQRPHLNSTRK